MDLLTLALLKSTMIGIADSKDDSDNMPDGMNAFVLTLDTAYPTRAEGWTLVIPHGLGVAPKFVIIQEIKGVSNAKDVRGWLGNAFEIAPENMFYTNTSGWSREAISIQDETAKYLRVDAENLYCTTSGWGGSLYVGDMLFVGVLA